MAGKIPARLQRRRGPHQPRPLPARSPGDAHRLAHRLPHLQSYPGNYSAFVAAARAPGTHPAARLRAAAGGHRKAEGIHPPIRRRPAQQGSQGPREAAQSTAQERCDDRRRSQAAAEDSISRSTPISAPGIGCWSVRELSANRSTASSCGKTSNSRSSAASASASSVPTAPAKPRCSTPCWAGTTPTPASSGGARTSTSATTISASTNSIPIDTRHRRSRADGRDVKDQARPRHAGARCSSAATTSTSRWACSAAASGPACAGAIAAR